MTFRFDHSIAGSLTAPTDACGGLALRGKFEDVPSGALGRISLSLAR